MSDVSERSTISVVAPESTREVVEESPTALLRGRLISIRGMTRPQRTITAIGAGTLLLSAVLVLTNSLRQPMVAAGVTGEGAQIFVPVAMLIVGMVTLVAVVIFALAGALTAPWYIRVPSIFGLAATLTINPFIELSVFLTGQHAGTLPFVLADVARGAQLVTLATLCALAVRGLRSELPQTGARTYWPKRAVLVALILTLTYYALGVVSWLLVAPFTHLQTFTLFTDDIAEQIGILPNLLAIVVYWATAGMIEWGDLAAVGLTFLAGRMSRGLWVVNIVAALAALVFVTYQGVFLHGASLGATVALCALLIAVVASARPRGFWPSDVPVVAVVVGAALLYVCIQVVSVVVFSSAELTGSSLDSAQRAEYIVQMIFAVLVVVMGLAMTARGRQPSRTRLSVVGLFLTIVGGVLTLIYAPHSLQAAGVPNAPTTLITVYALLAVAAIVALGASVAFARQPTTRQAAVWLNATLALVIGLAMVAALVNVLLPLLSSLGAISAGLTALLFLVSAAWDLATSGADITNGDSKRFPRSTRLLLYLAYVMVAALTFTYIGAQYLANGQLVPQYLTDADLVKPGIFALGVPAIILTFILRVGRTWRQRTQAATSAHL